MANSRRAFPAGSVRLFLGDFFRFAGTKGVKAFLFVFLGAAVEGIGIVLLIPFLGTILGMAEKGGRIQTFGASVFAALGVESRLGKLSLLMLSFAVLMIARAVIITIRDVTSAELEVGFLQRARSGVTHALAAAPWDRVVSLRHSRVAQLMGADIQQVGSATRIFLRDTVAVVMLGSQMALAFVLSAQLAGLALVLVGVGAVAIVPMVRRAKAFGTYVIDTNLSLIDDVAQFLGALKLAISQNLQRNFTLEFDATLSELSARQIDFIRQYTVRRLTVVTIFALIGAAALLLGITVVDVSPSVLITLLLILSRMNGPVMQLQSDAQQFAQVLPAYEKIKALEAELAEAKESRVVAESLAPEELEGPVTFSGVRYLHAGRADNAPDSQGGIQHLDVVLQPGTIVGITGASGAGKTTFADLLVGLYAPQGGEIRVNGHALEGAALAAWRNRISYAVQDPFLFHDTIRRNLLWANPEADEADLWRALNIAGAEDLVRRMDTGLETIVGERGTLLSGGERQRLCVARAILRKPSLIVFDEATNAIDTEAERGLFERLLQSTPHPTIVVIAHRAESLRNCRRILEFDRGTLISDRPVA